MQKTFDIILNCYVPDITKNGDYYSNLYSFAKTNKEIDIDYKFLFAKCLNLGLGCEGNDDEAYNIYFELSKKDYLLAKIETIVYILDNEIEEKKQYLFDLLSCFFKNNEYNLLKLEKRIDLKSNSLFISWFKYYSNALLQDATYEKNKNIEQQIELSKSKLLNSSYKTNPRVYNNLGGAYKKSYDIRINKRQNNGIPMVTSLSYSKTYASGLDAHKSRRSNKYHLNINQFDLLILPKHVKEILNTILELDKYEYDFLENLINTLDDSSQIYVIYFLHEYKKINHNRYLKILEKKCKKNNTYAMIKLAKIYYEGIIVDINKFKTFQLLLNSFKLGNTLSEYLLNEYQESDEEFKKIFQYNIITTAKKYHTNFKIEGQAKYLFNVFIQAIMEILKIKSTTIKQINDEGLDEILFSQTPDFFESISSWRTRSRPKDVTLIRNVFLYLINNNYIEKKNLDNFINSKNFFNLLFNDLNNNDLSKKINAAFVFDTSINSDIQKAANLATSLFIIFSEYINLRYIKNSEDELYI